MDYLIIAIYAVILLVSRSVFKKKYGYQLNATFLTTAIWCVFASIAVINPTGLRQPSDMVHVYSITFLLAFNVFSYVIKLKTKTTFLGASSQDISLKSVNYRIAVVEILCLAILSPLLVLGIQAILSGNAGDYRFMVYFGSDAGFFTKTIPVAILSGLMIMSLYFFFNNGSKGHLLNAILIVVAQSALSSGRGAIFCFLMLYLFLTVVYNSFNIKTSKLPIYIGVGGMVFMTVFVRGGNMFSSVVDYFSGSFSFLDYILDQPLDYGLNVRHYGFITVSPITEPLMYVIKVLGLSSEKIPSYYLNLYVQDFVDIGAREVVMYNNNTTTLLPFLLDGGWVGVIFGGFFLALISMKFYDYFVSRKTIGAIMYLYIVNGLFMTTISYQSFMSITPFVALAVIYFCVKPILKYQS